MQFHRANLTEDIANTHFHSRCKRKKLQKEGDGQLDKLYNKNRSAENWWPNDKHYKFNARIFCKRKKRAKTKNRRKAL